MKIETKFDVRDRVWFMPMFGDTPICGVVEIIEIKVFSNYCSAIYTVSHNNVCYELKSEEVFRTKDELKKTLEYETRKI